MPPWLLKLWLSRILKFVKWYWKNNLKKKKKSYTVLSVVRKSARMVKFYFISKHGWLQVVLFSCVVKVNRVKALSKVLLPLSNFLFLIVSVKCLVTWQNDIRTWTKKMWTQLQIAGVWDVALQGLVSKGIGRCDPLLRLHLFL